MPRFKKSSSNGDNHFALRAAHIFIFAFIYDITIYDYALRRKTWQVAFSIYSIQRSSFDIDITKLSLYMIFEINTCFFYSLRDF